jgi:hypothetical protein
MWPAAIAYILASDEQRNALSRDRHTHHVVHKHQRRVRRTARDDR